MSKDLEELFEELGDTICIADLNIVKQGALITHVVKTYDNSVQLWAGNPLEGKYAEELILNKGEFKEVMEQVIEEML